MFAAFVLLIHPFVPFSCFAIPLEMGFEAKAALVPCASRMLTSDLPCLLLNAGI